MERAERGVVRSSARLSNGNGSSNGAAAGAESAAAAARRAAAAALAAERRARAAQRAQEVEDSPRELRDKCRVLARAVRQARHLVVYTGAGISTAADIPDYRGPRGVWTRLQRGEAVGRVELSRARPTYTHMALAALAARGTVRFVVSQNCDGLHARAGLPRRALAELHGDMFAERCPAPACRRVVLRAFDTTTRTRRHAHGTRRTCPAPRCGRPLRDTIVHFGERARAAWPLNWAGALRHAAAADVVLCLGSSLKVLRRYPRLWRMDRPPRLRPRLFIVNLQWTPKDAAAELKINARCDAVLRQLARRLRLRVPRYRRAADPLLAHATPLAPQELHTAPPHPAHPAHPAHPSPSDSDGSAYTTPSEPDTDSDSDAADSDDALPLRRLQERLRAPPALAAPAAPAAPAAAPAPTSPDTKPILENGFCSATPDGDLRSFQVSMVTGSATILLRAQHAPAPPDPAPAPAPSPLRRFRLARGAAAPAPAPPNGRPPAPKREEDEGGGAAARLRHLLRYGPPPLLPPHPHPHPKLEPKQEDEDEDDKTERVARSAAAAIFARVVLLCRAQLYPGLHTIIAPPAPAPAPAPAPTPAPAPPPAAECAWCWAKRGSRRCLWYPALDPLAPGRVWRRVRGRRYLCTCCPRDDAAPAPAGDAAAAGAGSGEEAGEGGWYGKGYRKGRRRRR